MPEESMKLRPVRSTTTPPRELSSSNRQPSSLGIVLRSSSPASETIESFLPAPRISTLSRSPFAELRSLARSRRGGAAPLDRSTRSPQRAIPSWCATPMGQGDLEARRAAWVEALAVHKAFLGLLVRALPRKPDPAPCRACLQDV